MNRRTGKVNLVRLRRDEGGNILITTIIVSLLVGALASLALTTGRNADWTSASDRNHEIALGVAEGGVHDVISKIQAQATGNYTGSPSGNYFTMAPGDTKTATGTTPQGTYNLVVKRFTDGFTIDSDGVTGINHLRRERHVSTTLLPPLIYPVDSGPYTLFSKTSITMKNNDQINTGDVFANDSILVEQNAKIKGSLTSATSWIQTQSGSEVTGDLWSGGYNAAGWAMDIAGKVTGAAKASVTAPSDPATCGGETHTNYNVNLGQVTGNVTTLGQVAGGSYGSKTENTCTAAAPAQELEPFNDSLYTASNPPGPFSSAAAFNAWGAAHQPIHGVFMVSEPNPSQTNRLDLTGWNINGDTVIITNAPVFTGSITDTALGAGQKAKFIVVSHYQPATDTGCDVNHDDSDCSIHAKNSFQPSCKTANFLYADKGPVAVKNNSDFCGAIYSDGILVKNNQNLVYDDGVGRVLGVGRTTWEIGRWKECPPGTTAC